LAGSTTNLPPGKYQIYLAKVDNKWRAFAESGGKIVAESSDVQVTVINDAKPEKPTIGDFSISFSVSCRSGHCRIQVKVKW
jgi:hypothetical protein